VIDLVEGGVDHPVRNHLRAFREVAVEQTLDVGSAGHDERPPATTALRSSASRAARIARWA
jgi:hypothetical protein